MKLYILFVFFLFTFYDAVAQEDSIKLEIKNFPDSKYETISKARQLLVNSLNVGDYYKVKAIKDYLVGQVEDENYSAFNIYEYWLILYYTQEFDVLLKSVADIGLKNDSRKFEKGQLHYNDQLYELLMNKSKESQYASDLAIKNTSISQEEKDFLALHLQYCLSVSSYRQSAQDSLNVLSDKFIKEYPYSVYIPFVKKIIRYKEKVSDFAFAYTIYVGYVQFEKNIAQSLQNCANVGFSLDMFYKNLYFDFSFSIASSSLKHDIVSQSSTWNKDMKATLFIPQMQFGYTLFNARRINLTPTVGITMIDISPVYENIVSYPALENVYFDSKVSWTLGISLNFYSKPAVPAYSMFRSRSFQFYTQAKYSYSSLSFNQNSGDFNGAVHQISISLGFLSRRVNSN